MQPQIEQQLAYLLLVELLAHQFASPVQWIKTQDILLKDFNVERFIEIGPADTLTGMLKKTVSLHFKSHDAARHMTRRFLSYAQNAQEIHYLLSSAPTTPSETQKSQKSTSPAVSTKSAGAPASITQATASVVAPEAAATVSVSAQMTNTAPISDVPTPASEILLAIVGSKLRKHHSEVAAQQSIKALASGRSTMENEIVGDLDAEFGSLPEKPEDIALEQLGGMLESAPSFSGQLRKISNGLVSKFFAQKLPAGFASGEVRNYLQTRWGLGEGRQNAVLLRASTTQSSSRLGGTKEAEAFFDEVVQQYTKDNGINVSAASQSATTAVAVAAPVDSAALGAVVKDQDNVKRSLMELYARLLGKNLRQDAQEALKAHLATAELQSQLDEITAEVGDFFLAGIRPLWSAAKVRRFHSSWNWVLQDALDLFHRVLRNDLPDANLAKYGNAIANRSSPRLLSMMKYLANSESGIWGPRLSEAKAAMHRLLVRCEAAREPIFEPLAANFDAFIKGPSTEVDDDGIIKYSEVPRGDTPTIAPITIATRAQASWKIDQQLTTMYKDQVQSSWTEGVTFRNKYVLMTGVSPGSINADVLKGLLSGGAKVVVTTSSYSSATSRFYQNLYVECGARGSELIVAPFNQGSQQDLDGLVEFIFSDSGLGWDLDHVIPFAAISEVGREIDGIDSRSELAHRIMLTNTLRLLGAIKKKKQARGYRTRPTQVILPLSPNHGAFGNDGLYGESKIALETLFEKWHSESWSAYLSICGAVIGWTRGTGLMADNNIVAAGIECHGVQTFSTTEMAAYILVLLTRKFASQCNIRPLYADLTGGLNTMDNLKATLDQIRRDILDQSTLRRNLAKERQAEEKLGVLEQSAKKEETAGPPLANIPFTFPKLPNEGAEIKPLRETLLGMANLDRVVVVTGFSEVGPFGNARTRWQMEATGRLSLEGCVEMAWVMGLIKHHNGLLDGKHYTGWIDTKTQKPVQDLDVKARYEEHILAHTGIRLIDTSLDSHEPGKRPLLQEIVLEEDLPPFEVSHEVAQQLLHEHGEARVDFLPQGDRCVVSLKRGAVLMVPKALNYGHAVAGLVPTGWDARTYGIPDDIVSQVDRGTLFTLVSTVEALIASGITDPYELYQYIHVSEFGNCIGSGVGGMQSLKKMFQDRYLDKEVQKDILQETFINTTAAWVNMLLLSSSGPIRTAVGACATSVESLETGYETIATGRAKICLVGGYDDMTQTIAEEFANMKATTDAAGEAKKGRLPHEMSRPSAESRSGFVEAQGSGIQVVASAQLALDLGLPIQGIVAWVGTASDKIGRSVPAPGQGILTNAREQPGGRFPSPLLDVRYRKRRLAARFAQIQESIDLEVQSMSKELSDEAGAIPDAHREEYEHHLSFVRQEAERQRKEALNLFGNDFWKNQDSISPIRGALAVFGLNVDDLDFVTLHGTSTVMNDKNEPAVLESQMRHLGRTPGNPLFAISQKYLTGHPKGAAGAWMLNGGLQVLDSGLIPGNRNLDSVDDQLEKNEYIVYPNHSIQTGGLKAFSLTSFGFGQKGAQAIVVHPRYLYAMVEAQEYERYRARRLTRYRKAFRFFHRGLVTNTMFVPKTEAPYSPAHQNAVLLNPTARAAASTGSAIQYSFGS
ncbi:Fatty acid synthase alpha subunit [Penicillium ucsense]|uniref:Fatty acid synthase alpha subunit n=1 Tax=Penicillium ucsense TaxID=2839758 RepID=A0A8J8W4P0_9EURO|nr:Fatty acid synthase alpha subunit [Penicillium ucsense]KAF7733993.1 Fatty acid synthase alpha subunit [Penicillium ucsense]